MGNGFKKFIEHTITCINKTLICLSHQLCIKPSRKLIAHHFNIPDTFASIGERVLDTVKKSFGIVILPFQIINDIKFTLHKYESLSAYISPGSNTNPQNTVTLCEKMLIYLAQNKNKITEPVTQRTLCSVNIHNTDYDIPIDKWYTLKIGAQKLFFFVQTSIMQNYRGVLIASNNKIESKNSLLPKIKQLAIDNYDQTLGTNNTSVSTNSQSNFI